MNNLNPSFLSISQVQDTYLKRQTPSKTAEKAPAQDVFSSILEKESLKQEPLRFSKHAAARLSTRNIDISEQQMERLNRGKIQAGEKGIQESLILVDQLAFIVNVPNNTVVTAMNRDEADSARIFTNIDGAVIA
jgi:flagellar operon protein